MKQSANKSRSTPAESWFVATDSGAVEYRLEALKDEIERGGVHSKSLVWRKGMQDWVQLEQVPLLRMLAAVQPARDAANPITFATSNASISAVPLDEQFEDKTTVFMPPAEAAAETSIAASEHPVNREFAVDTQPHETATSAQSTSIFDGLFDSATAPDQESSSTTVQNAEQEVSVRQNGGYRPGHSKPDSVPRRPKPAPAATKRPVLARPATPRVSIAGISARTLESKPAFELPKREPIANGFAKSIPSAAFADPVPGLAATTVSAPAPSTTAGRPSSQSSQPQRSVESPTAPSSPPPTESPAAPTRTEHSISTVTPPIVLPLPMPPLPPPPESIKQSHDRVGEARLLAERAPAVVSPVESVLEPPHPPTAAQLNEQPAADHQTRELSVIVQETAHDCGKPNVANVPAILDRGEHPHDIEKVRVAQAFEGDSLFPSASSIHPGLFRRSQSRRMLLFVGSFGLAAAAIFTVVMATKTAPEVSKPRVSSENPQDLTPYAGPLAPVVDRGQPAASEPVSVPERSAEATVALTPREELAQPRVSSKQSETGQQADARRLSGASANTQPPRRTVRATGSEAIAESDPAESGQATVDRSESWEQGTVEKRAWMEPGF